jgi:AraC family transcriptional regulator
MIRLGTGEHFGSNKTTLQLQDCIVVEAGCASTTQVPWHYHENAYFYYHVSGHLREVNKKKNYQCIPGTALFHYWHEAHYNTGFSDDSLFYHLEFKKNWFDRHDIRINKLEGDFQLTQGLYQPLFKKIYNEFKTNDAASRLAIDGLSLEIFAAMMRFSKEEKFARPKWVERVREILNENHDEHITLASLSEETGLHPVFLSRAFPKHFHMRFGDYIRSIKLENALTMLQTSRQSITEIAMQCGFSDQSHFIRCFKEKYSLTPLQYRKKSNLQVSY